MRLALGVAAALLLAVAAYLGTYALVGPTAASFGAFAGVAALLLLVLQWRDAPLFRPWFPALRALLLGMAMFGFAFPFLFNHWIRGDYDRYLWVIRQAGPCQYLGSGPLMLWGTASAWLASMALLSLVLIATDSAPRLPRGGVVFGVALTALAALTMFPEPRVFASLLGCFR